ncbi:MAG: hypothetical protein AB1779_12080 [Candidatus Thermoplasmatota archaeon]
MVEEVKVEKSHYSLLSSGPVIATVIGILYLFWLIILPIYFPKFFGIPFEYWVNFGILIIVLLIFITTLAFLFQRTGEEKKVVITTHEPHEELLEVEPDYVETRKIEIPKEVVEMEEKFPIGYKEVIEYPKKVKGGIYGNAYIPLKDGRLLKLRTLLLRACILCEEQDICWQSCKKFVDFNEFKENVDCREGLKKMR